MIAPAIIGGRTVTELDFARRLVGQGLRIRRTWPRSVDHLLLELVDAEGRATAGQWFADPARARQAAARTPGGRCRSDVVLQPDGADRKLTVLASLIDRGARLIAHRPERRAVVAMNDSFTKIIRQPKAASTAAAARTAAGFGLGAPAVIDADLVAGTVTTSALPGEPLTKVLGTPGAARACFAVGAALARLHATADPGSAPAHGPEAEFAVLRRWTDRAAAYGLADRELPSLPVPDSGRRAVIHRDAHDGQFLLDGDRVAVLDFDLMAIGDPALDLANFLAHLELRAAQGVLADPESAAQATLAGYRPDPPIAAALPGGLDLARARLHAVYAFRNPEIAS